MERSHSRSWSRCDRNYGDSKLFSDQPYLFIFNVSSEEKGRARRLSDSIRLQVEKRRATPRISELAKDTKRWLSTMSCTWVIAERRRMYSRTQCDASSGNRSPIYFVRVLDVTQALEMSVQFGKPRALSCHSDAHFLPHEVRSCERECRKNIENDRLPADRSNINKFMINMSPQPSLDLPYPNGGTQRQSI